MKKQAVWVTAILSLIMMSTATTVLAANYQILIRDPNNPINGAKGLSMSNHWVGQIPITITSGSTSAQTMAFCMQPQNTIIIGSSYPASLTSTTDTATWRAVSYVLSWFDPTSNNAAAVEQAAIWRILNPSYTPEPWMDVAVDNAGANLAAQASGKDVVRQDDRFNWITPVTSDGATTKGNPGQIIAFIAQLTNSAGSPRANVKIQFAVSMAGQQLNSTYVSASEVFTNSQGVAQITVKIPGDTPLGTTIIVQASTHSIWPQRYVDLTDPSNQDLIGMGTTFTLTLSTNVCILAYIMVLPESAWGALGAVVAFAAAFVIYTRIHKAGTP